jgi:hypothetical protein
MRLPLLLALGSVASCGSRTIEPATDPGSRPTVEVWKEDLEDNSNSSVLLARNHGTAPVTITEIRLTVCDNLYQNCGLHQPNVRVDPGETVRVMRLDPSNHGRRPRFGWEFRWRGLATAMPTGVAPRPTITTRTMIGGAMEERPVEQLRLVVPADDGRSRCVAPRGANLPPGYRQLEMQWGEGMPPRRSVRVDLDAAGTPVRYNESRGDMRVPPPGVTPPGPIPDRGARSDVSMDLIAGRVIVFNVLADGTGEQMAAAGRNLLEAESLGRPIDLVRRMIRECGT